MKILKTLMLPGALASLALLTPALAQGPGGGGDMPRDMSRDMHHGPPPEMIARMPAREADDMVLLLKLRPDQRPALTAFLRSMAPPEPPRDDPRPGPDAAPAGFAQHLDRMTQDAARRAAEEAGRITAARSFYDALDPTQRQAFEALMRLRQGPGPGRGPGRGPGPHGPMQGGDGPPPPMGGMPPRP